MDWIGLAALLVAIVVGIVGWKQNRDTKADAKRSADAAEGSARAAERSADAAGEANAHLDRMAASIEVMAQRDERRAAADAKVTSSPAWSMHHVKGMLFEIENIGVGEAYGVQLSSENALRFDAHSTTPDPWRPGEAVQFLAAGSWQTGTPVVALSWRDSPDGELKEWTRPVPPRG